MTALIIRITRQMLNDKRSIALLLLAPILLLWFTYLLLAESPYTPQIAVTPGFPDSILAQLREQEVNVITLSGEDHTAVLRSKDADAVVSLDNNIITILMLEPDSSKVQGVTAAITSALGSLQPGAGIDLSFVYGKADGSTFDSYGHLFIGVLSFFFVFIISGISFVRERTTGTLERLMLTPIKRWQVVAGYTLGFGIFTALQSIIIVLFVTYLLGMEIAGSVLLVMLTMILLSFTAVSTGALVSIYANTELQVVQFIPVVIVPQVFLSGLVPIETLPQGLAKLAYIMPIYYGCEALKQVVIRGEKLGGILSYLAALLLILLVLFVLNTLALKRYRKL